jgi:hypothetical protein
MFGSVPDIGIRLIRETRGLLFSITDLPNYQLTKSLWFFLAIESVFGFKFFY